MNREQRLKEFRRLIYGKKRKFEIIPFNSERGVRLYKKFRGEKC